MAKPLSLQSILEAHQTWAAGQGGTRAVLIGHDLRGADLRGADLTGAELVNAEIWRTNLKGVTISPEGLHRILNCRQPKK
ncbi:MAG: hypothetical protein EXR02_03180 [Rhodospirillales bacterium]|nr:hypothetical protein [Rhodospirillales bacterium]MSP80054.1 hypothetical protein [Rhodospirillales bacterium]